MRFKIVIPAFIGIGWAATSFAGSLCDAADTPRKSTETKTITFDGFRTLRTRDAVRVRQIGGRIDENIEASFVGFGLRPQHGSSGLLFNTASHGLYPNGDWKYSETGMTFASLNCASGDDNTRKRLPERCTLRIDFDRPVRTVGAFVNYAPCATCGDLKIRAIGKKDRVVAGLNVSQSIPIVTKGAVNQGEYLNLFERRRADIRAVTFSNAYVAVGCMKITR